MDLPLLDMSSVGQFKGVHCGPRWACFDYEVDGHIVHLSMHQQLPKTDCETVGQQDEVFYINNGVIFDTQKISVKSSGANDKSCWKMAKAAYQQMSPTVTK